jgi:hypothetical protein
LELGSAAAQARAFAFFFTASRWLGEIVEQGIQPGTGANHDEGMN